jgi:predicted dehydrogenase
VSAPAKLRYGIVGCGRACERIHVPGLLGTGRVELVAAYDPVPENSRWLLDVAPDVQMLGDLEELLGASELDAVSVCTPNNQHSTAVVASLKAGVAVLCEKPLAISVEQARTVAAAVRDSGRHFALNMCHRFHPLLARLCQELAGAPAIDARLELLTPGLRAWRPRSDWYGDAERAGGGVVLDLGMHALDVLRRVLGEIEVSSCEAAGEGLEDRAVVEVRSPRGVGRATLDRRARRFACSLECSVPGEQTIMLDFLAGTLTTHGEKVAFDPTDRWLLAGVERFVVVLGGAQAEHAGWEDALELHRLIECAYALRRCAP